VPRKSASGRRKIIHPTTVIQPEAIGPWAGGNGIAKNGFQGSALSCLVDKNRVAGRNGFPIYNKIAEGSVFLA
jgi:hypothetical protein